MKSEQIYVTVTVKLETLKGRLQCNYLWYNPLVSRHTESLKPHTHERFWNDLYPTRESSTTFSESVSHIDSLSIMNLLYQKTKLILTEIDRFTIAAKLARISLLISANAISAGGDHVCCCLIPAHVKMGIYKPVRPNRTFGQVKDVIEYSEASSLCRRWSNSYFSELLIPLAVCISFTLTNCRYIFNSLSELNSIFFDWSFPMVANEQDYILLGWCTAKEESNFCIYSNKTRRFTVLSKLIILGLVF